MRVAIIGKGMGWWDYRPSKDSFDEIWSINSQFFYMYGDCTKVFEMHDYEWSLEEVIKHCGHILNGAPKEQVQNHANIVHGLFPTKIEGINKLKLPLISVRKYDFIPTSTEYPREIIVNEICNGVDLLQGTLACAIAYAMFLKYSSISLFGCGLKEDWSYQVPSIAFLYGIATERGMHFDIHTHRVDGEHPLHSNFHYGYLETYP